MKNIMKILAAVLALCMVFGLCACGMTEDETKGGDNTEIQNNNETENKGETENNETTEAPEKALFNVLVVDQNGTPVEGVMVQICKDACIPAKTDAEGIATFNIEATSEHKVSIMTAPAGYTYEAEEIYLEDGATEFRFEITKEAE